MACRPGVTAILLPRLDRSVAQLDRQLVAPKPSLLGSIAKARETGERPAWQPADVLDGRVLPARPLAQSSGFRSQPGSARFNSRVIGAA